MIGAGELRERVTIQARGLDLNGDARGAWAGDVTVWARVRPRIGTEPVLQARLAGVQPYEVAVRSSTATRAMTTAHRLLWKGVPLAIKAVAEDPSRAFLLILAQSGGGDA